MLFPSPSIRFNHANGMQSSLSRRDSDRGRYPSRDQINLFDTGYGFGCELTNERALVQRVLTHRHVIRENVVARAELHGEAGFPDIRCAQHAYPVSRHPFITGFYGGELRG